MKSEEELEKLFSKLEFPSIFPIKLIAPIAKLEELSALMSNMDAEIKFSSKSNYISISAKPYIYSKENLISFYLKVGEIEGVISL